MMDPHSTFSRFNHRVTKAGPASRTVERVKIPSTSAKKLTQADLAVLRRPIVTNSRVKQDEIVKRDMYLSFVSNAIDQKAMGNSEPFDELVAQFSDSQINTAQWRLWLNSLSHVVSRLERMHASLVHAVVNMPWVTLDNATVKSYIIFIGSLLSARPEYLSLVLSKLAQGFTYQMTPSQSDTSVTRRVVYDRQHHLLRHLLILIPTLPSTLQPLLVRNFPHKRQNQIAQTTYIRNLLRIGAYCPELADRILATIIDRAIQIDVEIQIELEELEDFEESTPDHDVFELDPFDVVVGQEGDTLSEDEGEEDEDDGFSDLSSDAGDSDNERPNLPTNHKHIQEMVNKLDSILVLLFEHLERTYKASNAGESSLELPSSIPFDLGPLSDIKKNSTHSLWDPKHTLRAQFDSLLSIFDRTILRTFKSRYTQFLLFWYSSLDPEFADVFQGMLVDRALLGTGNQPSRISSDQQPGSQAHMSIPELTRAAAASYIGSFVSRATFVDREGTRRVVGVLCEYLRAHLDGVEESLKTDWGLKSSQLSSAVLSPAQHTIFYAVTQAVFLIFCFRWRDLQQEEGDEPVLIGPPSANDKWIPELAILKRVVTCVLNPLRVCSSNVVMQFARIAQATGFVYCYTILDANKRTDSGSETPQQRLISLGGELGAAELNTFFPFDPYRLPKSGSFVQGVYREWASVALDDEEDSEEDEDEDEDEDKDKVPAVLIPRRPASRSADEIGASFGAMSISPR